MQDENVINVVPETSEEVKIIKPKKVKKTSKASKISQIRTIEELESASIKSMSDSEKNKYIEHLRDQLCFMTNKADSLNVNARKAFEQFKAIEQQFKEYKMKATAKLQFAKQAIGVCHNSIILAGNIED